MRALMRLTSDLTRPRVFAIDAGNRCGVERFGEGAVHGERLGNRRRGFWQPETNPRRFGRARCPLHDRVCLKTVQIHWDASDRMPHPGAGLPVMERLARHRTPH